MYQFYFLHRVLILLKITDLKLTFSSIEEAYIIRVRSKPLKFVDYRGGVKRDRLDLIVVCSPKNYVVINENLLKNGRVLKTHESAYILKCVKGLGSLHVLFVQISL